MTDTKHELPDIDWSKPVQIECVGKWRDVKGVMKNADGLVIADDGDIFYLDCDGALSWAKEDWFRNTPPPKPEPYECWVVKMDDGTHKSFMNEGEAQISANMRGLSTSSVIHMREVDSGDE